MTISNPATNTAVGTHTITHASWSSAPKVGDLMVVFNKFNANAAVAAQNGWAVALDISNAVPRRITMFVKTATGAESGTESYCDTTATAGSAFTLRSSLGPWGYWYVDATGSDVTSSAGTSHGMGTASSAVRSSESALVAGDSLLNARNVTYSGGSATWTTLSGNTPEGFGYGLAPTGTPTVTVSWTTSTTYQIGGFFNVRFAPGNMLLMF